MTLPTPSVARNAFANTLRLGSFGLGLSIGGHLQLKLWVELRKLIFEVFEEPFVWYEYQRLVTTY